MVAGKLFIACAIALLIGNVVYYSINPDAFTSDLMGGITSFVVSAIIVLAVSSVNVATFSLSDSFISLIMAITTLINLFFQMSIAGHDIGFGLLTNMITLTSGSAFGIGGIIINAIGLIMFISAMMIVNGAGA